MGPSLHCEPASGCINFVAFLCDIIAAERKHSLFSCHDVPRYVLVKVTGAYPFEMDCNVPQL